MCWHTCLCLVGSSCILFSPCYLLYKQTWKLLPLSYYKLHCAAWHAQRPELNLSDLTWLVSSNSIKKKKRGSLDPNGLPYIIPQNTPANIQFFWGRFSWQKALIHSTPSRKLLSGDERYNAKKKCWSQSGMTPVFHERWQVWLMMRSQILQNIPKGKVSQHQHPLPSYYCGSNYIQPSGWPSHLRCWYQIAERGIYSELCHVKRLAIRQRKKCKYVLKGFLGKTHAHTPRINGNLWHITKMERERWVWY